MKQKQVCKRRTVEIRELQNSWYNGTGGGVWKGKRERGDVLNQGWRKDRYIWRPEGRGMKTEVRGRCNEDRRVRVKHEGRRGKNDEGW
jgi:hypothetical protein